MPIYTVHKQYGVGHQSPGFVFSREPNVVIHAKPFSDLLRSLFGAISEMLVKHIWEMTAFLRCDVIPRGQVTHFEMQAG